MRYVAFVSASIVCVACGSTPSASPPDDATSDTAVATDSAAVDTRPSDAASIFEVEGEPPCDRPDGGAACSPGKVACGSASCDVASQYCCMSGMTSTCVDVGTSCASIAYRCDEKSDCPAGHVCCLTIKSSTSAESRCLASCGGGGLFGAQLCHTDSECGSRPCTIQRCNGMTIEACGLLPYCTAA